MCRSDNPHKRNVWTRGTRWLTNWSSRRLVHELPLPLDVSCSGGNYSQGIHLRVLKSHSKDAHGPGEHAGNRIGALRRRVLELRLQLDVPCSGGHYSHERHCVVLTSQSDDAHGPGKHAANLNCSCSTPRSRFTHATRCLRQWRA